MIELAEFLRRSAALPLIWGERDCALWAAEWIGLRRGDDPAAHLHGQYSTRTGCLRILLKHGGLLSLAASIAAKAGLERVSEAAPGDVACLKVDRFHVLGIAAGNGRIAMKAPIGVTVASGLPLLAVWRV